MTGVDLLRTALPHRETKEIGSAGASAEGTSNGDADVFAALLDGFSKADVAKEADGKLPEPGTPRQKPPAHQLLGRTALAHAIAVPEPQAPEAHKHGEALDPITVPETDAPEGGDAKPKRIDPPIKIHREHASAPPAPSPLRAKNAADHADELPQVLETLKPDKTEEALDASRPVAPDKPDAPPATPIAPVPVGEAPMPPVVLLSQPPVAADMAAEPEAADPQDPPLRIVPGPVAPVPAPPHSDPPVLRATILHRETHFAPVQPLMILSNPEADGPQRTTSAPVTPTVAAIPARPGSKSFETRQAAQPAARPAASQLKPLAIEPGMRSPRSSGPTPHPSATPVLLATDEPVELLAASPETQQVSQPATRPNAIPLQPVEAAPALPSSPAFDPALPPLAVPEELPADGPYQRAVPLPMPHESQKAPIASADAKGDADDKPAHQTASPRIPERARAIAGETARRPEAIAPTQAVPDPSPVPWAPTVADPSGPRAAPVARQIADAIAARMPVPPATGLPAAPGPVRILTIRLDPAELGAVTVRMRLVGGALELHFHAESDKTAELLERDRDALSEVLRASGYDPGLLPVGPRGSVPAITGQPSFPMSPPDPQQQVAAGSGNTYGRPSPERRDDRPDPQFSKQGYKDDDQTDRDGAAGDLYV